MSEKIIKSLINVIVLLGIIFVLIKAIIKITTYILRIFIKAFWWVLNLLFKLILIITVVEILSMLCTIIALLVVSKANKIRINQIWNYLKNEYSFNKVEFYKNLLIPFNICIKIIKLYKKNDINDYYNEKKLNQLVKTLPSDSSKKLESCAKVINDLRVEKYSLLVSSIYDKKHEQTYTTILDTIVCICENYNVEDKNNFNEVNKIIDKTYKYFNDLYSNIVEMHEKGQNEELTKISTNLCNNLDKLCTFNDLFKSEKVRQV
ncbi:hypothetical protein CLTEP_22730 [Clostridium tepidiprofundi DSM 19306]|uniref:5-bromo-4-chloroindolyl phosphate hydrolysis protein n=1 Tax=Clostridium tepidiprofundi DSM 19306 TaxID=1121338 RepID=A0A151AX37_9CLOT|nr:hypothetical protein [Clostridium tepidiprofundi]KYH32229.1 hypothetical protein CLTEP_22730 [Clostridium tepidiprofundi DSM 19306]